MDFLQLVVSTPGLWLGAAVVAAVAVITFAVAVFQGREVTFWPPKIGPRVALPNLSQTKMFAETTTSLSPPKLSTANSPGVGRDVTGVWICQYHYPHLDPQSGKTTQLRESQVVALHQSGQQVSGRTLFAQVHPEEFTATLLNNRFLTGTYANSGASNSYHGAFQLVLSANGSRMRGRWLGFDRHTNLVETDEWRWLQVDVAPELDSVGLSKAISSAQSQDLFSYEAFV